MAEQDYYTILGVSKTATDTEIKSAYRKLALQYHPDRNKSKDAEAKFKEVTKAYEVLGDPQKRQTYDQFGASAFEQGGPGGPGGGNPFAGQYGPFTYSYSTGGDGGDYGGFSDPFEIFEQFFGGGFSRQRQRRPVYSLTINFNEAVHGITKTISVDNKKQTIKIPAGVDSGSRIRFGDYDVLLEVIPDKRFHREGADVVTEEELSFAQAAMGTEIKVETVDGQVTVRVPAGTQPGTVMRLREKGIARIHGGGKGDHYIKIKIIIPKHLTNRQKELLKEFDSEKSKKGWF